MKSFRPALKTLLIAPYLLLLLATAAIIGALSYRAASAAVDDLSGQLLTETVHRISQAVQGHVAGSPAVLDAAFPQGVLPPTSLQGDLKDLRTRFWLATSVHRDPNNYAYYGDRTGRFFGLWRYSEAEAELRLRTDGNGARQIHLFSGLAGSLAEPVIEQRLYDPRSRPWFRAAQDGSAAVWSPVYVDFKNAGLVTTLARRVDNAAGDFEGVVATDLSLQQVNAFLKRLSLKPEGVAIVVERDGQLIGASRGQHLRVRDGQNIRLNAADSEDRLVSAAYAGVARLAGTLSSTQPSTTVLTGPDGGPVQVGYSRLKDDAGLDWLIIVAVPRQAFLQQVQLGFRDATALSLMAALGVALIGLTVLGTVTGELRKLTAAVRSVAEGDMGEPLTSDRNDELGALERSFGDMQRRLLTDPLTGLANREAMLRRLEMRMVQHRRRGDSRPFAVAFIDLNHFKLINDRFGHDVGDAVLRELGQHLQAAVRSEDMVARFGGDEFVVLLDSVSSRATAQAACEHMEAALRQPLKSLDGQTSGLQMGGACGLAVYPDDGRDIQTLLKHADEDMYQRKTNRGAGSQPPD